MIYTQTAVSSQEKPNLQHRPLVTSDFYLGVAVSIMFITGVILLLWQWLWKNRRKARPNGRVEFPSQAPRIKQGKIVDGPADVRLPVLRGQILPGAREHEV